MNVAEREEAYQHLKAQLMRGELDEGDFKRGVDKLTLTDSQGKHWKMGWYTGKWYYEVDGQWIQGTPDEDAAQPVVHGGTDAGETTEYARRIERITRRGDEKSRRFSSTTCLVLSLVAVL